MSGVGRRIHVGMGRIHVGVGRRVHVGMGRRIHVGMGSRHVRMGRRDGKEKTVETLCVSHTTKPYL